MMEGESRGMGEGLGEDTEAGEQVRKQEVCPWETLSYERNKRFDVIWEDARCRLSASPRASDNCGVPPVDPQRMTPPPPPPPPPLPR